MSADDITDAELDAMEDSAKGDVASADLAYPSPVEEDAKAHKQRALTMLRLIAALREARRRIANASSRGLIACGHCDAMDGEPCKPDCGTAKGPRDDHDDRP